MASAVRDETSRESALAALDVPVLTLLCAVKLMLHLFTSCRHYGYFRDELYFLDLARHLDWGYVDCAPLIAVYAKLALMMGGSLAALRILPALAGTLLIALSMLIARELGGARYAQFLTGLAVLLCPGILVMDSLLTMNAFEPLFWMGCILLLARFLRFGNSRLWIWFGVLAGLGIENKHSTVFFLVAVTIALLLTEHRREWLKPWIWIGTAILLALAAPNFLWQLHHHFPMLEDMENVRRMHKNVVLSPAAFVKEQIIDTHPILFPVWLSGLVWLLASRRWRLLGLTFAVFFATMEALHAKSYYLFPIYPLVLAAGAVAIDSWLTLKDSSRWVLSLRLRTAIVLLILFAGAATLPVSTWMLSPSQLVAYEARIGFKPAKTEVSHESLLPQPIADQFGWREMTRQVAYLYNSLPPEVRAKTAIIAGNYGEAGAINLFGPRYGLPIAISTHQNYWYWGPPQKQYENLIALQASLGDIQSLCTSYQSIDHYDRYGMAEENTPIYLCRGVKFDFAEKWPQWKKWN
jgi:4-amino-4-deoxy-L-arabinose transferase-like glycosyltransferase